MSEVKKVKIVPGVSYHSFDDKVYVHSVDSQKDYIFSGIALDILDYCSANANSSIDNLCDWLAKQYEVDKTELQNDIEEFVGELMEEKILYETANADNEPSLQPIPVEVGADFVKNHRLFSLTLELTYRCVEKCIHCYIDDSAPICTDNELTLNEYKNILLQAKEMGCVNVLLTGGEVLLKKDFCDIAEYAASLGFIVNVYTTGVGLTDEVFERLCAIKLNSVSFSLYSGNAIEHDKITGVKGSFEKTLKAMLMFRSAGVHTFIKSVVMRQNAEQLESLYQLGKRLKIHVTISPRVVSGHEQKSADDYSLGNEDLYRKFFRLNSRYITDDYNKPIDENIRQAILNGAACGAGLNTLSIDPFGGVHACVTFKNSFGSIRNNSLKDIWEQSKTLAYLKNRKTREIVPLCETCKYIEFCQVCVAELIQEKGDNFKDCGETFIMAKAAFNVREEETTN